MKSIFTHRSIRKFNNTPIDKDILQTIFDAASRASNTGNMQLYSIVATTDSAIKSELCKQAHFNQQMVQDAPIILTFCADLQRFSKWCAMRNANPGYDNFLSFYTASIDATIAAQNACLAAEELGLGICYLGTTNYMADKIVEILHLPKLVVPVTSVVMGYATETPPLTHRLPLSAVVHSQTYKPHSENDINSLYAEKESLQESIQFVNENKLENLAQVFTHKRYTTENNKVFSQNLLQTLAKQGFMNND